MKRRWGTSEVFIGPEIRGKYCSFDNIGTKYGGGNMLSSDKKMDGLMDGDLIVNDIVKYIITVFTSMDLL